MTMTAIAPKRHGYNDFKKHKYDDLDDLDKNI